jgi:hypothetical protein
MKPIFTIIHIKFNNKFEVILVSAKNEAKEFNTINIACSKADIKVCLKNVS